jgi:hypothetical protein
MLFCAFVMLLRRNYKIPDGKPPNRFLYEGVFVGKVVAARGGAGVTPG